MIESVLKDVEAVQQIDAVPTILEVVTQSTGLGFVAVVRVTDRRWVACAVRDEISFGILPGGELQLSTTVCRDVAASRMPVAVNDVIRDGTYCNHAAPARHGFRSFVAVPLVLAGGEVFGTLFACSREPADMNTPQTLGMFSLFADLISQHLNSDRRETAERVARDVAAERLERLQSVIESASDYAVISIDLAGRIDGWSTGAVGTFGWTETEAIGKLFDLIWTARDGSDGAPARELKCARDAGMCPDNRWHVRRGTAGRSSSSERAGRCTTRRGRSAVT